MRPKACLFIVLCALLSALFGSIALWMSAKRKVCQLGALVSTTVNMDLPYVCGGFSLWGDSNVSSRYPFLIKEFSLGKKWLGYEAFTKDDLDQRDKEYLTTLESNINHPLVKQVHLFYDNEEALQVVHQQAWMNSGKILPVRTQRRVHMMDFFWYASKFLLDEPIIALNGDIVIGEGFDRIDTVRMRDQRVLYTLTRHGHKSRNCTENLCLGKKYRGSHDTHIFALREPLDENILLKLDYPINMWQAENGMIGAFKYLFNFTVLNPCHVLKTYHHHCSHVHKRGKMYSIRDPPYEWRYDQLGKAFPIDVIQYG